MRRNRPTSSTEPRHRKPGPARLGGADVTGRRARDASVAGPVDGPVAPESDEQPAGDPRP